MSLNTYYRHPAAPGELYKTQDANQRCRLVRAGWIKAYRHDLDRVYGQRAVNALSRWPDGRYRHNPHTDHFARIQE